jgi:hypothetical protein
LIENSVPATFADALADSVLSHDKVPSGSKRTGEAFFGIFFLFNIQHPNTASSLVVTAHN